MKRRKLSSIRSHTKRNLGLTSSVVGGYLVCPISSVDYYAFAARGLVWLYSKLGRFYQNSHWDVIFVG